MTAQSGPSVPRPENFATGGDYVTELVQNNVDYKIHVYQTPGTFSFVPAQDMLVEYLVVGGGGGGSDTGAGGAGGYRCSLAGEISGGGVPAESPLLVQSGVSVTVVVGAGGNAGPDNGVGTQGGSSQFGSIISLGGGAGGRFDQASAGSGGSGGGGGLSAAGLGTAGQGFNGGPGWGSNAAPYSGGGGGGAGGLGSAGTSSVAGNGGPGQISSIDGTPRRRSGGGSGQTWVQSLTAGGIPGDGGGGLGAKGSPRLVPPTPGFPVSGGGGGGGDGGTGGSAFLPQAGGSGIVIVRYRKFPLVLSIDAASNRSYLGTPGTVNRVSFPEASYNTSTAAFSFAQNFDQTNTRTVTFDSNVVNPINASGILRYTTGTTGYKFFSILSSVPSSGTYTFSYFARIVSGPPSSTVGNSQIWRDTGITDRTPTGNWNPTLTTEWQRFSVTSTVTNSLEFFPVHGLNILGGFTLEFCGFQLESGSVSTEWVNGTRANAIFDLSSNANNCTPINGVTASTVSGVRAFNFNGTNQHLTLNQSLIGSARGIPAGDCSYSIEAWINVSDPNTLGPDLTTQGASIIGNSEFAGIGIQVFKPTAGLRVNFGARGTSNFSTNAVLAPNTWHYIAAVRQRGQVPRIYVNGVLDASETLGNLSVVAATGAMTIGYDTTARIARYFPGRIGLVRLYSTALSAEQVRKTFLSERRRFGV